MKPKVVFTCFAGRRKYMEIMMEYVKRLHEQGSIDEVHLWDFTRCDADSQWIKSTFGKNESNSYIKVQYVQNKGRWSEYYNHYTKERYPNHVIIKSDDDVVFIDVDSFNGFVERTVQEDMYIMRFASIVNNNVCAYHQQQWGLIPLSLSEFPYECAFGKLWNDGALCTSLHSYFLDNHKEWLAKCKTLEPKTHAHPLGDRFSINMFAICSKNLDFFQKIANDYDDEYACTVVLTRNLGQHHAIDREFTVCHLGFYMQRKTGLDENLLIERYTLLSKK